MTRPPASPGPTPGPVGGTCAFARVVGERVVLDVLVVPGASRSRLLGAHGDRVRIAVAEPPEGGRANTAVVALVAATLQVPVRAVRVHRGDRQRRKTLEATAPTAAEASAALARLRATVEAAALG